MSLQQTQQAVAGLLTDIAEHFKKPVITLIVRSPDADDQDFILTTDTVPELRKVLDRMESGVDKVQGTITG